MGDCLASRLKNNATIADGALCATHPIASTYSLHRFFTLRYWVLKIGGARMSGVCTGSPPFLVRLTQDWRRIAMVDGADSRPATALNLSCGDLAPHNCSVRHYLPARTEFCGNTIQLVFIVIIINAGRCDTIDTQIDSFAADGKFCGSGLPQINVVRQVITTNNKCCGGYPSHEINPATHRIEQHVICGGFETHRATRCSN